MEGLQQAFVDFCNALPFYGVAIACLDDRNLQAILPRITRRIVTYGLSVQADVTLKGLNTEGAATEFTAVIRGVEVGRVRLSVPGRHVALNSLAAIATGLEVGLAFDDIARGLSTFEGVDRRMSMRGDAAGVRVIDDYAHHPTEISTTLAAIREAWPQGRIVAIFQPHRFSRVAALFDEFCRCFNAADIVLGCPVYAAGEEPIDGMTGEALCEGIRAHGHRGVEVASTVESAASRAAELARPGDTIVTLGAGDIHRAADIALAELPARSGAAIPRIDP